ncbi:GP41 [Epinotia aporema granulovirus]|uniref:GP41 n=1 Tax=Epinotia aporema granulovirus TaxID=166056 RepID=K4ERV1_9BBAC|nr:GP41 [Epinotia aporema granulovirus]AER41525.1 GP41 [Epinotia aporema granulovirus]
MNWSGVADMINLYKTNNTSKLSPEQISCMNMVRDLFLKADPVPVSVNKRFESDEQLIEYYGNLEKKYGSDIKLTNAHTIFDKSFIMSPIMKTYADKFYKRRLNLAASHLSDGIKYQMANAVTQNKPIPLIYNDATDEYLRQVYQKTDVAPNLQHMIDASSNSKLCMCTDIINNVVEDVLTGSHNGYYVNTCLYPHVRNNVLRFRDNITFLLRSPLTLSTNVYGLLEKKAQEHGQNTTADYSQWGVSRKTNIPIKQSLSEMAFENEALRRGIIQNLNIKYSDIIKKE